MRFDTVVRGDLVFDGLGGEGAPVDLGLVTLAPTPGLAASSPGQAPFGRLLRAGAEVDPSPSPGPAAPRPSESRPALG